jgi:PAS domain S-box-containing protein
MAKEMKMTANRRLQDDLAASEARYRAIVEDQTELICRYTPDLSVTFANRAYCRFLHKKHHEVYGQTLDKLGASESAIQNTRTLLASLTPAAPLCISEYAVTDAVGEMRWVQWTNRAFFDNQGRLVEVQSVGRDITQQKQLEKELAHFEQLNLIGQMAAGISHEIRNPMTTVRGFLQLLSKKEECQPFKGYFDLMIEELDRANSILSEFLALARNKKNG